MPEDLRQLVDDLRREVEALRRMVSKLPVRWPSALASATKQIRFFKVDSAAAIAASNDDNGNPTQWVYQVTEVVKTSTGYNKTGTTDNGVWSAVSGGYTGNGYNMLEDGNTGTGQQQNGVDHDGADYPASWQTQALKTDCYHPGVVVTVPDGSGGTVEEALLMPYSGEDGTC